MQEMGWKGRWERFSFEMLSAPFALKRWEGVCRRAAAGGRGCCCGGSGGSATLVDFATRGTPNWESTRTLLYRFIL